MKLFHVVLAIPFFFSSASYSQETNRLILNTFSYQCPQVVTRDVSASLQNIEALKNLAMELKNDAACGNANELAIVATRYADLFEDLQVQNEEKRNKLELEKKVSSYIQIVNDETVDTVIKDGLKTDLVLAQSELIGVNSKLKRFENFSGRESKAANQLIYATEQFLQNLNSNPACIEKKGVKVSNLVSNALLTVAAFSNPGTALALASSSVILKSGTVFYSQKKYNDLGSNLDQALLPTALRCYSEALTEQYCSMEESKNLIQKRADSLSMTNLIFETNENKNAMEGINLLAYQLSGLKTWLEEIYSGSEITTEGDLVNRKTPIKKVELLKEIKMYAETYANIVNKSLLELKTDSERSKAIAIQIDKLSSLLNNPSLNPSSGSGYYGPSSENKVPNPIFETRSIEKLPFDLYRPGKFESAPDCGFQSCTFQKYAEKEGLQLTFEDWKNVLVNANEIIQSTLDRVNNEKAKVISVDAYRILVNANRDLKGELNAINGLKKILSVSENVKKQLLVYGCPKNTSCEKNQNSYYGQLVNIERTQKLTSDVLNLVELSLQSNLNFDKALLPESCRIQTFQNLQEKDNGNDFEQKSFLVVSCISKLLKLEERGVDVYFTKVRDLVSYDLEAKLKNGDLGDIVESVVLSTKNDLVQSILNSYRSNEGNLSLQDVLIGIDTAQNNLRYSFEEFSKFNSKDLENLIQNNRMSRLEKADFCFRMMPVLLTDDFKSKAALYEMCKNEKMQLYKDGPNIVFEKYFSSQKSGFKKNILVRSLKSDEEVLCDYRRYSRDNKLLDEQIRRKELEGRLKKFKIVK